MSLKEYRKSKTRSRRRRRTRRKTEENRIPDFSNTKSVGISENDEASMKMVPAVQHLPKKGIRYRVNFERKNVKIFPLITILVSLSNQSQIG